MNSNDYTVRDIIDLVREEVSDNRKNQAILQEALTYNSNRCMDLERQLCDAKEELTGLKKIIEHDVATRDRFRELYNDHKILREKHEKLADEIAKYKDTVHTIQWLAGFGVAVYGVVEIIPIKKIINWFTQSD